MTSAFLTKSCCFLLLYFYTVRGSLHNISDYLAGAAGAAGATGAC